MPLLLFGCTDKVRMLAKDTTIAAVSMSLQDYVGINGFAFKYQNIAEDKASFLIFVERTRTVTPAGSETTYVRSTSIQRTPTGSIIPSTRETTGRVITTETPSQVIDTVWNFNVQLVQKGNDVYIISQSNGGFDPSRHFRGFIEQLKDVGIKVESWNE